MSYQASCLVFRLKKHQTFIPIEFLSRGSLINTEEGLDSTPFLKISAAKQQADVRKKQVIDASSSPGDRDSCEKRLPSFFV